MSNEMEQLGEEINKLGIKEDDCPESVNEPDSSAVAEKTTLNAAFINIGSLRTNIEKLREFVEKQKQAGIDYDIIGVAETHLDSDVEDEDVSIPTFEILRKDRTSDSGGIALYYKETFEIEDLMEEKEVNSSNVEFIFCLIRVKEITEPFLVSVLYRPEKSISFTEPRDFLAYFHFFCLLYKRKIIMGDLNADMLRDKGTEKYSFKKYIDHLQLKLIPHGATHHWHDTCSHTWIDIILVDDNEKIFCLNNRKMTLDNNIRYHHIIDVWIKLKDEPRKSKAPAPVHKRGAHTDGASTTKGAG